MKFSLGTETKRRPRALLNRHPYRDGSLVSRTEDRFNRSGYLARCQHPLSQTRHPARRIAATSRAPSFINAAVSKYGTDYSKRMPRVGGRDRTKERAIDFLRSTNWKLDWGGGARRGEENKTDRTRVFRRYEPILSECHALIGYTSIAKATTSVVTKLSRRF